MENNSRLKEEWNQNFHELQEYEEQYHSLEKKLNKIIRKKSWNKLVQLDKDIMKFLKEIDKCPLLEQSIKYQDNEGTRLKLLGEN